MLRLRFLSRQKSIGFGQKNGEKAKERKGEEDGSEEVVYKVKSYKVCKVGEAVYFFSTL